MEIFSSLSLHISSSVADLVTLSFKDFVRKVFFLPNKQIFKGRIITKTCRVREVLQIFSDRKIPD